MFQHKTRKFRRRPSGRNHSSHSDGMSQNRARMNPYSNNQPRNNFKNFLSPEKMFEKYSSLAKEATSSGDKTLAENYLQHADHFMRTIEDRNRNRIQNKKNATNVTQEEKKELTENGSFNQEIKDKK
jgi:hypothetical protein